jgi:hypothetical protein
VRALAAAMEPATNVDVAVLKGALAQCLLEEGIQQVTHHAPAYSSIPRS